MGTVTVPLKGLPLMTSSVAPTMGCKNSYDATAGGITVSLPLISTLNVGAYLEVEKFAGDVSSNVVQVSRQGTDQFEDGRTAVAMQSAGQMYMLQVVQISSVKKWSIIDGNNPLIGTTQLNDGAVTNPKIAPATINNDRLSATGSATNSTFLRGDGTWAIPPGSGASSFTEYANLAAFPATGTAGVLYVAVDTNKTYRWTGSVYVEVSPATVASTNITDSTAIGRSVLTAATTAAARTAIGAGTSNLTTVAVSDLSATGTKNSTTFLRGDNTFAVPPGSGSVAISGTPTAGQIPIATSGTTATWQNQTSVSAALGISVTAFGATGDGSTNDTTAIQNAYNSANSAGKPLYFPAGTYVVTALPDFANDSRIIGDGSRKSTILYNGSGTLRSLTGKYGIAFENLGWRCTSSGSPCLMRCDASFRISFFQCRFLGNHNEGTGATYRNQVGLFFDNNNGAANVINCDFENLGAGIRTNSIQNYVTGGKFTRCWHSIWGDTAVRPFNAGMHCQNVEFVGANPGTTASHIFIDGSANAWHISGCWFEQGDWEIDCGVGANGPSMLYIAGCEFGVAASGGCRINAARQPMLINNIFNSDNGYTAGVSREVLINGTNAGNGKAINNITTIRSNFVAGDFPNWNTSML